MSDSLPTQKRFQVVAFIVICLAPVHLILLPAYFLNIPVEYLKPLKLPFAMLPLIGVVLVTFFANGESAVVGLFKRTFQKGTHWLLYPLCVFVFPAISLVAFVVNYFIDGSIPNFDDRPSIWLILAASPFLLLVPGILEEYGWRGFLQEKLETGAGLPGASIAVGTIWGTWHLMDFLMGNWYFSSGIVAMFYTYIIGVAIVIGALYRLSKGAVFVAMLSHFSANLVNFFIPIWRGGPNEPTLPMIYVGLVWIFGILICLFTWRYRDKDGEDSRLLRNTALEETWD